VILARLNAAFQTDSVAVIATLEGGALRLTSTEHGSGNGFTVAYTDPGVESPATQLGIAAGAHDTGVDAVGTLNGVAMTGAGQLLTGVNGLVVRYTSSDATLSTTVRFSRGLAGALTGAANSILVDGDGTAAQQETSARARIASLERRESDISSRLERRRAALIADFTRMETTLGRLQSQGSWLSSQITSIQNISASANG
jgi:flagellar hook-associated protein 2